MMEKETSWEMAKELGLDFPQNFQHHFSSKVLMYYGPLNPGEYFLTKFTAEILGVKRWKFLTYKNEENCRSRESTKLENLENVLDLENIIDDEISIGEMAKKISSLSNKNPIVVHLWGRKVRVKDILNGNNLKKLSINELHSGGGWLAEAGIHFLLRQYAKAKKEVIYLCPFCSKGQVYELYRGLRPLFVLVPGVKIQGLESMGRMGWIEFKNLRLSWQEEITKIIRNAVNEFFLKKYPICRVEIPYGWWR